MINSTSVNRDSLFNSKGSAIATVNNLNMANLFFKYGFRLEKNLVKDLFCAPIVLASGKQSKAQYIPDSLALLLQVITLLEMEFQIYGLGFHLQLIL